MTARSLMYALSAALLLVSVAAVGGFYIAQTRLHAYAESITQLNADAEAGDKDIAALKRLEQTLAESKSTIDRTKAVVAESKQYVYQNQIIEDIANIANRSGITVTSIEFPNPATASGAAAGTGTPPPAPVAPTAPGAAIAPGIPAAGASSFKSVVANVGIKSPVSYTNLMKFIQAIEYNRMKMQIANVSLSGDEDGNVASQGFAIEVYTR